MKHKLITLSIIVSSVVGGWLLGQETNKVSSASSETEQKGNALSNRLSQGLQNVSERKNQPPQPKDIKSSAQTSSTNQTSKLPRGLVPSRVTRGNSQNTSSNSPSSQANSLTGKANNASTQSTGNVSSSNNNSTGTTTNLNNNNQNNTTNIPNNFGQVNNLGNNNGNVPADEEELLYSMTPPPDAPDSPFDLINVLELYAEVAQRMPIRRASVNGDPQIYVNFTDLTREEAKEYLEYTFAINGISIIEKGAKFFQVTEVEDAGKIGGAVTKLEEYDGITMRSGGGLGGFVQVSVKLKYIPTEIAKGVLDPFASKGNESAAVTEIPTNNLLILKDYEPNVRMMLDMLKEIDINVPLEVELELIPIRYALADEISQVLGTLTPSGAVSGTSSRSSSSRFGSGRSRSTTGNQNTLGNRNSTTNRAGSTSATQNRSAFQNRLSNIVNRAAAGDFQILGDTKIIPDERTNSILVFANKRDMAMIKQIIGKLDVVQAQVLIEAVIMEVSIGDNEDLGFSIVNRNPDGVGGSITDPGLSDTLLSPGQFAADGSLIPGLPSGFSYFSSIGSDINVAVRALASNRKASVLQRPRIQTFHAREASITVGESRPFVGGTFFGTGFGGANGSSSSQINYQDISVELHVLPLINQEGLVVLEIEQIVKDLNGFETIDGNRIPVVANRSASASVAVQDGQTIILGGMITTNKSVSESGVPILKEIPVMGNLFKNKTESENQVELVVLIKPKVMPTPEIAKDVASDELEKLVVTQQARIDIEKARAKIAEKIKADMEKEHGENAHLKFE